MGSPVDLKTWIEVGRNRTILLLLLITTLQMSGQFVIFTFMGPLLAKLTGAGPDAIGLAVGWLAIGARVVVARRLRLLRIGCVGMNCDWAAAQLLDQALIACGLCQRAAGTLLGEPLTT